MNDPSGNRHASDSAPRVFVTGATGLLGNNVVRELLAQGFRVRALVRSREKAERCLKSLRVELVVGDMLNVDGFSAALTGCDAVLHTAAYFREYYQPGDHDAQLTRINVDGALRLMELADAAGVRSFVHTSSSGAVGTQADGTPGDEDTPPHGEQLNNGYFRSKMVADAKIKGWQPPHGMRIVEVLPGWMFGPGDAAPTASGQLVLDFLHAKIPAIPQGGTNMVDARDVARAMIACMKRAAHGSRYIVAGEFRSMEQVLRELEEVTQVRAPRWKLPYLLIMLVAYLKLFQVRLFGGNLLISPQGVRFMATNHRVSSDRARHDLNVTFRPFLQTLQDVVSWYESQGLTKRPQPTQSTAASQARS